MILEALLAHHATIPVGLAPGQPQYFALLAIRLISELPQELVVLVTTTIMIYMVLTHVGCVITLVTAVRPQQRFVRPVQVTLSEDLTPPLEPAHASLATTIMELYFASNVITLVPPVRLRHNYAPPALQELIGILTLMPKRVAVYLDTSIWAQGVPLVFNVCTLVRHVLDPEPPVHHVHHNQIGYLLPLILNVHV